MIMSENNKNDETEKKEINFDDEKEPIESIEKTVEDLKRKIQELSDEDQKEADAEQKNGSAKEKISDTIDSAAKSLSEGLNGLKDKAAEAAKSEEMQKSIAYIKANVVKAIDVAKDKFNQLKNDPNIMAAGNKAADSIEKFADAAKTKGQDFYDHLDDNTKTNLDHACNKVTEAVSDGVKSVDEFMNRPEVQQKITEVKTTVADLAQKGSEKVKEFIDNTKK